jgi:putative transposase
MRTWNFLGKMDEEIPMKKSRFTEAQIMGVLRQAEGGLGVPELCRVTCHGIFPPPSVRFRPKLRTDNEADEIHG